MASNSLGNSSLILSTAGGQLVAGLAKSQKDIERFANDTNKKLKKSFDSAGKSGGSGGLLGGLLGKGAGPIAGIVAGVMTIDKAFDTLAEKTKLLQVADAFQVDPQKFSGIAGLAKSTGEDIKEFTESLVTMGKMGAEAAAGTGQVSQQAFKEMGINAKEFIGLSVDQQFMKVFESLNKVSDPLTRVRNMMVMFGEDGGKYLLPLLSKSPAQLQAMAKGFEQSEAKMRSMAKAQTAIGAVKTAFDSVWTTLIANLAPVIELIANRLVKNIQFIAPAVEWVSRAFATHWGFILDVVGEVVDGIFEVVGVVADFIGELLGLGNTTMTIEQVITEAWHGIGTAVAYVYDGMKAGVGVVSIALGFLITKFAEVAKNFADLRASILNGMADAADAVGSTETAAALRASVADVERLYEGIGKAGEKMQKWGQGTLDNFGNSAKDVDKWFDKRAKKAEEAAKKGVAGGKLDNTPEFKLKYTKNDALMKGSAEGISAEIKYKTEAMFSKPKDVEKQQLNKLEEINKGILATVTQLKNSIPLMAG